MSSKTPIPPRGLVEKAIAGNLDAFGQLYTIYLSTILYLTGLILDKRDDVEDVAQEIVIKMMRSIGTLKNPQAFRTWMYRIITMTCYNHNTAGGRRRQRSVDVEDYENLLEETDTEVLPAAALEQQELSTAVMRVINKLPQSQRMVIYLRYYEEMDYSEIAKALGITTATVGTNIMKAKKKLKTELAHIQTNAEAPVKPKNLGSLALAPLVAASFEFDQLSCVSPDQLARVKDACDCAISALVAAGGVSVGSTVASTAAATGLKAAVVTVVGVASLLGGGALINENIAAQQLADSAPIVTTIYHEGYTYAPNAQIDFTYDTSSSKPANPVSAILTVDDDGGLPSWLVYRLSVAAPEDQDKTDQIIDPNASLNVSEDPTSVISGTGNTAENLLALEPGSYEIVWIIQNADAAAAQVKRSFIVNP